MLTNDKEVFGKKKKKKRRETRLIGGVDRRFSDDSKFNQTELHSSNTWLNYFPTLVMWCMMEPFFNNFKIRDALPDNLLSG